MVKGNGDGGKESGSGGKYEAYSHYQDVSKSIAESIDAALSSYAKLDSLHAEGAKIRPDEAAGVRSDIKLAALKLVPELREDAPRNKEYQQILARWHGSVEIEQEEGAPEKVKPKFPHAGPEGGYFEGLSEIRLQHECPPWLEDWVIDIRTAGWEIGYLRAGRSVSPEPDVPDPDEEFKSMFADY